MSWMAAIDFGDKAIVNKRVDNKHNAYSNSNVRGTIEIRALALLCDMDATSCHGLEAVDYTPF